MDKVPLVDRCDISERKTREEWAILFLKVFLIDVLRHNICDFAGHASELPISIQTRSPARKLKMNSIKMSISFLLSIPYSGSGEADNFIDSISREQSLELSYWYYVQMVRIGIDPEIARGRIPISSNPFREEVSREVLFFWHLMRPEEEKIFYKDYESYLSQGYMWLRYYYGFTALKDIPKSSGNVLSALRYGRWEIVKMFLERGDHRKLGSSVLISISTMNMNIFLRMLMNLKKEPRLIRELRESYYTNEVERFLAVIKNFVPKSFNIITALNTVEIYGREIPTYSILDILKIIIRTSTIDISERIIKIFFPIITAIDDAKSICSQYSSKTVISIVEYLTSGDRESAIIVLMTSISKNEKGRMEDEIRKSKRESESVERYRKIRREHRFNDDCHCSGQ